MFEVPAESLVTFRGNRVVPRLVVDWIEDVERRGGSFTIDGCDWRVTPTGILGVADLRFILSHRRWSQIYEGVRLFSDGRFWFHE